MTIIVEQALFWDDYQKAWINGMKHLHWFKEHGLFDYSREEEIEEIINDFGKPENVFFIATQKGREEIAGVLGIKLRGKVGLLRRWEPALPSEERYSGAGEALIQEAFKRLRDEGALKASCMLRYRYDLPETGSWHIDLYKKCGFKQIGPKGIGLFADLSQAEIVSVSALKFDIADCDDYPLEDLAGFILKAYASTAEDKVIHGWDPLVSNREEILRWLRLAKSKEGEHKIGFSPRECCKVALVDGEPAGLVGSLIRKEKYRPPFGVLGPVGVFPESRRRGIAYSLIMKIHEALRKYGCHYSYVSTSKTNENAIRLYKKAGYKPVFIQNRF